MYKKLLSLAGIQRPVVIIMYMSVNHALNDAYFALIKVPYKVPVMNLLCVKSSGHGEPRTWDEIAGQAGMVFCVLHEFLTPQEQILLDAWKITPETQTLEDRKLAAIKEVSDRIASEIGVDRHYCFVVAAQYCGIASRFSEEWWANKLATSTRTLRRLRNGSHHKLGINDLMDRHVSQVLRRLTPKFYELGWLP